jgi:hypothetical protein
MTATLVVSVMSTLTAAAAVAAAKYTRDAKANSERALRLLRGEDGIDGDGLLTDVREHREALLAANLYPPRQPDGGEGVDHDDADRDLGVTRP